LINLIKVFKVSLKGSVLNSYADEYRNSQQFDVCFKITSIDNLGSMVLDQCPQVTVLVGFLEFGSTAQYVVKALNECVMQKCKSFVMDESCKNNIVFNYTFQFNEATFGFSCAAEIELITG
jgi:hypothetical protein